MDSYIHEKTPYNIKLLDKNNENINLNELLTGQEHKKTSKVN